MNDSFKQELIDLILSKEDGIVVVIDKQRAFDILEEMNECTPSTPT